jgi:three-Cys-motif partner protein
MSESGHRFGGVWTEVKLAAISAYSQFFTTAIGGRFDLWYVDPFAGTGERTAVEQEGGLFEGAPLSEVEKRYPGSAARALELTPPFDHLRFGDANPSHVRALQELVALYPNRDAKVFREDANSFIQQGFAHDYWLRADTIKRPYGSAPPRALVFLDPYGMEVQWKTLEVLASCEKADVWFLANLKAAVQQLCHKHSRLDASKRRALGEYFGTGEWEQKFYTPATTEDMFGMMMGSGERTATKQDVALFHRSCLEGLFRYVSAPLQLAVGAHDDYFLLYCMSNNPSAAARALIKKGADHVVSKYTMASRRRSARLAGGQ